MKVNELLVDLSQSHAITFTPIALEHPTTTITYTPLPPSFTLRLIREQIASLGFTLSVIHVDGVEERAAHARIREHRHILLLLAITLLFAIPTFTVAVVGMSLIHNGSTLRAQLEMPAWGNASLGTIILFVLATPVQFGVGWFFHQRTWKGLKGVWRTRKAGANWRRVWCERLLRWGSMDTLVSLGTSTGYLASLALMILDIRTIPMQGMMGGDMGWFDSSVFLMVRKSFPIPCDGLLKDAVLAFHPGWQVFRICQQAAHWGRHHHTIIYQTFDRSAVFTRRGIYHLRVS